MKIIQQTIDLPEELWKAFTIKYTNWTEKTMTTDLSPNIEIDNPITWQETIKIKYHIPILNDISEFNLEKTKTEQQTIIDKSLEIIKDAKIQELSNASHIISFIVE